MEMDLENLRKLAEAATPGPWVVEGYRIFQQGGEIVAHVEPGSRDFIAAANPQAVLALLDLIKRQREALEKIQWLIDVTPNRTDELRKAFIRLREIATSAAPDQQ